MPCRVQYLEDADPFGCGSFPEPRRAPVYAVEEALPLGAQLPALHRLLGAPLPVRGAAGGGRWGGRYRGGDRRLEGAGRRGTGRCVPAGARAAPPGRSDGGIREPRGRGGDALVSADPDESAGRKRMYVLPQSRQEPRQGEAG